MDCVQFSAEIGIICHIQTGSGAHTASYPKDRRERIEIK
jgi:hypothetical protein